MQATECQRGKGTREEGIHVLFPQTRELKGPEAWRQRGPWPLPRGPKTNHTQGDQRNSWSPVWKSQCGSHSHLVCDRSRLSWPVFPSPAWVTLSVNGPWEVPPGATRDPGELCSFPTCSSALRVRGPLSLGSARQENIPASGCLFDIFQTRSVWDYLLSNVTRQVGRELQAGSPEPCCSR